MIKEKHLVPGRVLLQVYCYIRTIDGVKTVINSWVPCLVISFIPDVRQRHSRAGARRMGWNVLVMWMDDRQRRLETVYIPVNQDSSHGWKVGW